MSRSQGVIVTLALAAGCAAVMVLVRDYRAAHPAASRAAVVGRPGSATAKASPRESQAPAGPMDSSTALPAAALAAGEDPAPPATDSAGFSRGKAKKLKKKPKAAGGIDARRGDTSTPAARPAPPDPMAAEAAAVARAALSYVGADPEAEAVWMDAINDPDRTAHERSDLIEDLNEDGFPDPKHLTPDDLPLIENRLALIEQLAPDAMDEVNAAAFAEAYKDLMNMYARAAGE